LADRATRRSRRAGARAPPRPTRTRLDSRRARRRRTRVTIDARTPVQRARRRTAGRLPHPLADGARRAAPPRDRATGQPHLPPRRLHLRVRLLTRLHKAPRRTTRPLPKADQKLPRRLTPADSSRHAARTAHAGRGDGPHLAHCPRFGAASTCEPIRVTPSRTT